MSAPIIGRNLERIRLRVVHGSSERFGLIWRTPSGDLADLTGLTINIVLDSGDIWPSTIDAPLGRSTWELEPEHTVGLQPRERASCVIINGGEEVVAFAVDLEIQR